jgi:inner membrane protein
VENLCHSLYGAALARAGLDRLSPLATATCVVAANAPDVDVVTLLGNGLWYLEHHRGVTHSFVGLAVEAPIVAGGFVLFDRLVRRRRDPTAPPARFLGLLVVALVGLASHLFLDWTNSYGVRPLLPFDRSWFYGDIVFVVDPWLWLALGGALFLGTSRRRWPTIAWSALFALLALVVAATAVAGSRFGTSIAPAILWGSGLAAIAALKWRWRTPSAQIAAIAAICAVAVYWCALALLHHLALEPVKRRAAEIGGVEAIAATPTPMRPDRWQSFLQTASSVETAIVTIDDLDERYERPRVKARGLEDPAVAAALATCPGRIALGFNRFLFASVTREANGGATVRLGDARFGDHPAAAGNSTTKVQLDRSLAPLPDDRTCPVPYGR